MHMEILAVSCTVMTRNPSPYLGQIGHKIDSSGHRHGTSPTSIVLFINMESSLIQKPTTTFVEDESIAVASYSAAQDSSYAVINNTMADFLAKPFLISSGNITYSSAANSDIVASTIATGLMSNSYWTDKMQGYNLVRGTAVLRLQINASPFQQGALLMHYLPIGSPGTSYGFNQPWEKMHNHNLVTRSQHPGVIHNFRNTTSELRIPYCTPTQWYSIKDGAYDWGEYYVTVLSPLLSGDNTGSESTVAYSLWLSFEDFEMAAPIVPQAGAKSKKRYSAGIIEEKNAHQGGVVSGILSAGAKFAGAFKGVPMLSAIAGPVEWAAGVASGIAGAFGWSKPANTGSNEIISRQYDRYSGVSNGVDPSYPVALIAGNKTRLGESTVYEEDEMSFAFLKRREYLIYPSGVMHSPTLWNSTDATGTVLWSVKISPESLYTPQTVTHTGHVLTAGYGGPMYYLNDLFTFWRGCVRLKVLLVKTGFHSGRLQVTWTPHGTSVTAPTTTTGQLALREIIDIREGEEFVFDLPYMLFNNYLYTNAYSGQLDIVVLNPLKAPDTCYKSIELVCFVSAGDDFEFQVPASATGACAPVTLQAGLASNEDQLVSEVVGHEPCGGASTQFSEESVGEYFTSTRQILQRYCQLVGTVAQTGDTALYWPWMNYVPYNTASGMQYNAWGGLHTSFIGNMFAFYKGSMRIMVPNGGYMQFTTFNTTTSTGQTGAINTSDVGYNQNPGGLVNSNAWFISYPSTGTALADNVGVVSATIPYYARTKCSLFVPQTTSQAIPLDLASPVNAINMYTYATTAEGSSPPNPYFACNDDFQFMFFIGCPGKYISAT